MDLVTLSPPRPCERFCPQCRQWKHHSRFRVNLSGHSTVSGQKSIGFKRLCKSCEQIERNERKNEDRARWIIEKRAAVRASELGVSKDFMWTTMNWKSLVPIFRALCEPDGCCLSCGHPFDSERDIQIDHHEPPRFYQDWAREQARNLVFYCLSCNSTKRNTSYPTWLDAMEDQRLSNERSHDEPPRPSEPQQIGLFS
jgi:hypothetical protein